MYICIHVFKCCICFYLVLTAGVFRRCIVKTPQYQVHGLRLVRVLIFFVVNAGGWVYGSAGNAASASHAENATHAASAI